MFHLLLWYGVGRGAWIKCFARFVCALARAVGRPPAKKLRTYQNDALHSKPIAPLFIPG
jgi:hypothetical protein